MDRETSTSFRPYRSHAVPACEECRRGKTRCLVDLPNAPCQICRKRQTDCVVVTSTKRKLAQENGPGTSVKRLRRPPSDLGEGAGHVRDATSDPQIDDESPLLLNPTMAEDMEILETYLTSKTSSQPAASKPYKTMSNVPGNQIFYLTVPRRREGLRCAVDPGRVQREILEQILGPLKLEVVNVYFRKIHPCFPILDETTFLELWRREPERISSALICDVYASSLLYWQSSSVLRRHPQPDLAYAWNQAVAALQDDFTAPTMSTVHAALLDMAGRPVIGVTGNITSPGRTYALATSLGLHRDSSSWKATRHEKNIRRRLWWGVVIHDHWSSLSHGTPPIIQRAFYDVPLPTIESLVSLNTSDSQRRAAMSFLYLCSLTQILGDILPLVYSLDAARDNFWKILRKLECSLDDWEDSLPEYFRSSSTNVLVGADGSSHLWFCFLSLRLLLRRLGVKATLKGPESTTEGAQQYRFAILKETACDVADFIISLSPLQLNEFWMPYTSYLLVSATTILLRCSVEAEDQSKQEILVSKLIALHGRLQSAWKDDGWDLAKFCVDRFKVPIRRLSELTGTITAEGNLSQEINADSNVQVSEHAAREVNMRNADPGYASAGPDLDFLLPVDSLDYPWENLWDSFDGPWQISI